MRAGRDREILKRIFQQARPYRLHLSGVLLLSLLGAPMALLSPLPIKIAVDSALGSHPLPGILRSLSSGGAPSPGAALAVAITLMLVTTVVTYLEGLLSWRLQTYTSEKLVLEFRARLFGHLQRMSLAYHDTQGSSDSVYRIQFDASCMQWVLITSGLPLLTAGITLLGMLATTAFIDWQLAVVALIVCPVLFFLTKAIGERIRGRWSQIKKLESAGMAIVQEVLASMRVVKAFGREDHEQERFLRTSSQNVQNQVGLASIQGVFDLCVGLTISVGTALVMLLGVQHVRQQTITLGELLVVMAYLAQLYEPLKTISRKITDLQSGLAGAERAFSLLDRSPEVAERPDAIGILRTKGDVEFRSVCFSYDDRREILKDVKLHVKPGARVGLQGRTGAGKSTLINLLMRFYDPAAGQILLDGRDLREYLLADLRNQFALVLQDPVLFSTTIAENIAYGNLAATPNQIEAAARQANADEFIRKLPDGYSTQVGERGMKLSGGERQRISIARAFLKNAPILILDEPTSSVDVKTEAAIMSAMERLMEGRTSFLIAHRLTTLEKCDVRIELDQGVIQRIWTPREEPGVEQSRHPVC